MKILSTLVSVLVLGGGFLAQNQSTEINQKIISNPIYFSHQEVAHEAITNRTTQSQWVDYTAAYMGNYGSTPNGVIGNFLFPDTTILVDYGTGGYAGPWIHSVAQTFDMNAAAYLNTGIGINGLNDITIDSIEVVGSYLRPDNSVVDTLVVSVVNVGTNLNSESYFQGQNINVNLNADSVFIRNLDWDQPSQKVIGPLSVYKIPLDQTFFASNGGQGLHRARVAAGDLISSNANGIFAITIDFIPGYTWNANLDTLGVNKNGWIFGSYELNGSGTYPNYSRTDYNVGSIVNDNVRYDNAGGWNGSYIPSYAFMGASPNYLYESMAIAVKLTQHTPVVLQDCAQPFFSEYIEGSGNNKALEIFNPTNSSIDLSNYQIRKYANGSTTPTTVTLSGTVASNDVFVIANQSAMASILAQTDLQNSTIANFNGDDAIELYDVVNARVIDVIGQVGVDPGSSWTVGSGSTANNTLVRMNTIRKGTDVWVGFVDQQWNVLANDDVSDLGGHANNSCFAPQTPLTAIPTVSNDTICAGETVQFSNASTGGTTPYTVAWNFGNGNTSTNASDAFTFNTFGVYQISLTVTDGVGATDDSVFYIVVNNVPTAGMTVPSTICTDQTVAIAASNYNAANTYVYSDGTSTLSHANGVVNYMTSSTGSVTITQTVTSAQGCTSVATETIVVNPSPTASFTHSGSPTVSFTDGSTNAVAWAWTFGDGNTSTTQNPSHTFGANGTYNVALVVTATNGCTDTTNTNVAVGVPSFVEELAEEYIRIYPNPSTGEVINIESAVQIVSVKIYNVIGQNVFSTATNLQQIEVSRFNKGTYFMKIETLEGTVVRKISIE
ncbi:MAG: PKD domain-containing protein [Flavobacteriales bacterium]|jgi:PKD repeat protein|nr:PKD domain-containing protein [Flavobacteriales bacterium]